MTDSRPAPFFIAESVGLDFLNSIARPGDTEVDWIASGWDLLAWLKQADVVPHEVLDSFRRSALPGQLDAIAAQARALRDWFKPFVHKHRGRPIGPRALRELEPLNRLLMRDEEFVQIVVRERPREQGRQRPSENRRHSGLIWRRERHWESPETLILPLARSLADLVCSEDFTYIKQCEAPGCTLLFMDRTRARARRWCSMAICGNRAKQAAHRKRVQAAGKRSTAAA